MEGVHEAPPLVPHGAVVLGVVVENPRHQGCGLADDAGGHRHGTVGVEPGRLAGKFLAGDAFGLFKLASRQLGADRGLAVDDRRVVLRLRVADANPFLHEGGVLFGELANLFFAPLELTRQPESLPSNGGPPFRREVALGLLAAADDRFADPHLDLGEEPFSGRRIEVFGCANLILEQFEGVASAVRVGRQHLTGGTNPNGGVSLLLLAANAPPAGKFGKFAGLSRRGVRFCSNWRLRLTSQLARSCLVNEGRLLIIGIAAKRGLGKPGSRGVRSGGLSLRGKRGQPGGLAANHALCSRQAVAADNREKKAIRPPRVAGEFGQERILRPGFGSLDRKRRLCG